MFFQTILHSKFTHDKLVFNDKGNVAINVSSIDHYLERVDEWAKMTSLPKAAPLVNN